jgi:hypothetical protein
MRHRERYLKAWIASTGMRPEDCELQELTFPPGPDGIVRVVVRIVPRGSSGVR